MVDLDRIDKQLLRLMQKDARLTVAQLGEKVGLSASPCARRVRALEEKGFITGIHARVDRRKLGFQMTIFVHVRLSQHQEQWVDQFEHAVLTMAEVVSCHIVSGAFDYLMQVVVRDLGEYERWVKRLQGLAMVAQIDSSFAIRTVKEQSVIDPG
ncbi:Lrp/AsnC family transcriptional regulator [Reinekea sp. G2M2-21]|uniref:Lrp/AsnC family transcriptional regulator n=1 Tax=Reinekea sp. G2M2-21 TaxID=2788942 RepID=UPI0018AA99CA|nr:Lrp/AsnC family transcriptional regulator [Reinekea sp. G2M2-21]